MADEIPEWCRLGGHIRFHDHPTGWYRSGPRRRWRTEELIPYGKATPAYRSEHFTCPECNIPLKPLVEPKYKFECPTCKTVFGWSFGGLTGP